MAESDATQSYKNSKHQMIRVQRDEGRGEREIRLHAAACLSLRIETQFPPVLVAMFWLNRRSLTSFDLGSRARESRLHCSLRELLVKAASMAETPTVLSREANVLTLCKFQA